MDGVAIAVIAAASIAAAANIAMGIYLYYYRRIQDLPHSGPQRTY